MVQLTNFERPSSNNYTVHTTGPFTVSMVSLYGTEVLYEVRLATDLLAIFSHTGVMPVTETLRVVHDLMFLWIAPVCDPRALIMEKRDNILSLIKNQLRDLVGAQKSTVRHFHKQELVGDTMLHLTRYYDPVMDRILTQAVSTPLMDVDDRDAHQYKLGNGFVGISPSWLDPGPFTAFDMHYARTDDDVAMDSIHS